MTQSAARRRVDATKHQRSPAQAKRQRLSVVTHGDRIGRITPTAALCTVIVAGVVFGALFVQISLINRQVELDGLRAEVVEMQLSNKSLRERESRVQSPDEILRIAEEELGMVEAAPPALATPQIITVGAIPTVAGAAPSMPEADEAGSEPVPSISGE